MITIVNKKNCCGCQACAQICPKQCITMVEDEEGFLYPTTNTQKCVECGLCEKVCPTINQGETCKPLHVYAAKNPNDEIRMASSSGGIFTMLAELVIDQGGVVFGARFNEEWEVEHDYTETVEGLAAFRGSKYVQSTMGENYKKAECFLKEGRQVLFSGTPCQIAGLKRYLKKEYDNLLAVDVVCHGVPSPKVWRDYLQYILHSSSVAAGKNTVLSSLNETPVITGISFRDKSTGWKKYGFVVHTSPTGREAKNSVLSSIDASKQDSVFLHETLDKNIFMQGFLKNIYLRPSCYACSAKAGKSGSDITIADFWGIGNYQKKFDDDKGVGLVLVNTQKGQLFFDRLPIDCIHVDYQEGLAGNPSIEVSVAAPTQRKAFWNRYQQIGTPVIAEICDKMKPSLLQRIISRMMRTI